MPAATSGSAAVTAAVVATLRAAGCVFAEHEAELLVGAAQAPDELDGMVRRRAQGEPLEHVVGWADFCGLRVGVAPGVFVPRPRSELLVRRAAVLVRQAAALSGPGVIVVDLACGSGAIGLAVVTLAHAAGAEGAACELHATDIWPPAVQCARRNLDAVGGQVHLGDLYDALPAGLRGRIDVLVANVPYVPSAQVAFLPPEARLHEPLLALDGGADGLDVLRRVVARASAWLRPGGRVLLEVSAGQATAALATLSAAGLEPALAADEELGATVVTGTRANAA
jgi:release factor glutamine methyltransferase